MLDKIGIQLWNKCVNEFKKEENISLIENELFIPLVNRYNDKMRQLLIFIYTMYLVIIILLIIILAILLFNKKYL